MAELKTRPNQRSVTAFLQSIRDARRRRDARTVGALMRSITRARPRMWGPSIVGYGRYDYRYESGREGSWFLTGFSPRKTDLVVYIMSGFGPHRALLRQLGPHRTGRGCLYLRDLEQVHLPTLRRLIAASVRETARRAR